MRRMVGEELQGRPWVRWIRSPKRFTCVQRKGAQIKTVIDYRGRMQAGIHKQGNQVLGRLRGDDGMFGKGAEACGLQLLAIGRGTITSAGLLLALEPWSASY